MGVPFEPCANLWMLMGGIVIDDRVDDFAGGDFAVYGIEEADELLMGMLLHAAANNGAVQDIKGSKERGRAVAFVVVGHGAGLPGLERQTRLSTIQSLDLGLLIDGKDQSVGRRVHVEADDILDFFGERGIIGSLESAQAMGRELVGLPDALDGAERKPRGLCHGTASPMGDLAGGLGTGQRYDIGHRGHRRGRLARFAGPFAQEPFDAALRKVALPSPDRRSAHIGELCYFEHGQPISTIKDNPRALDMLQRAAPIADDRGQTSTVFGRDDHRYGLGHDRKIAQHRRLVNPTFGSVH